MIDFPTCGVCAAAGVRVPWSEIAEVRRSFGTYRGQALASLVRQSDEQTVLAVAAVLRAIDRAGWRERSFENWGVVASGRSFGRVRFGAALDRFRRTQARGTSPLIVPHLSLHSMAGTLSIALDMHGPNYGVSGQAEHLGETLLAGLGLVEDDELDGLWIVASDLEPELFLDGDFAGNSVVGHAAALALSRGAGAIELTLGPGVEPVGRLGHLAEWIDAPAADSWRCGLAGVGVLELTRVAKALRQAG
jgi:hypothetical protein